MSVFSTGAAPAIIAAAETAAENAAATAVAQGRVLKGTLAALNAALNYPADAIGEVDQDGANNGQYKKVGASGTGSWTKTSSATINGLDVRATNIESVLPAGTPRHGARDLQALIEIGADTDAVTWLLAWMATTGADAWKLDAIPSQSLANKIGALLGVDPAILLASQFDQSTARHGIPSPFGVGVETGGVDFWSLRVRGGNEPEAGRLDVSLTTDAIRNIRNSAPVPSAQFAAVEPFLLRDDLLSKDSGRWVRCCARVDIDTPGVAVDVEPDEVIGSTQASQSNGVGGLAGTGDDPVTTTAPAPHNAFTMTGGQKGGPIFASFDVPIDATTVTDLTPTHEVGTESPVSAKLRWLYQRDLLDGRTPYVYVGDTHGYAGKKLAEISKGSVPYTNGMMLWDKASKFTKAYRKRRIWYPKFDLRQGEADRASTQPPDWAALFRTFRTNNEDDIRATTGQLEPVWAGITQLCAVPGGTTEPVGAWTALGQEEVVVNADGLSPRTTFNCPTYFLQGAYGMGGVHYKSLGDALLGEYEAKADYIIREKIVAAIKAGIDPFTLTNRDVRTCLRVDKQNVSRVGSVVHVPLILPDRCTGVVVDTTTLPAATNLGWIKMTGTAGNIAGVTLSGSLGAGYELLIQFDSFVDGQTATLRYAYMPDTAAGGGSTTDRASAWGNIKATNSYGTSIAVSDLPLDDWLCVSGLVIN